MTIAVGSELWILVGPGMATQSNVGLIGQFSSVPCSQADVQHLLPFVLNPDRTGFQSFFSSSIAAEYAVEWDCERSRRSVAPHAPSRFGCLYLFQSLADAQAASARYSWKDPLRRVRISGLASAHVVDMETVSFARQWYRTQAMIDVASRDAVWEGYWRGRSALPIELPVWRDDTGKPGHRRFDPPPPIWEVLLDGRVEVLPPSGV